jgi:c-di-GMP-binding flagellar brake protein YcgR
VTEAERRRYPRYPLRLRVVLRLRAQRKKARAILMDLSRGGMLIRTKAELPLGSEVVVSFRARPEMHCEAHGRVVRVLNTKMLQGFGIDFDQRNDIFEKLLTLLARLEPELRQRFLKETIERDLTIL